MYSKEIDVDNNKDNSKDSSIQDKYYLYYNNYNCDLSNYINNQEDIDQIFGLEENNSYFLYTYYFDLLYYLY